MNIDEHGRAVWAGVLWCALVPLALRLVAWPTQISAMAGHDSQLVGHPPLKFVCRQGERMGVRRGREWRPRRGRGAKGRWCVGSLAWVKVKADNFVRMGAWLMLGCCWGVGFCGLSLSAQLAVWVQTFELGGCKYSRHIHAITYFVFWSGCGSTH